MSKHGHRTLYFLIGLLLVGLGAPTVLIADNLNDFECEKGAIHIFSTFKPSDFTFMVTEHYCELKGKRHGQTTFRYTDYTRLTTSFHIVGKYKKGKWVGRSIVTDVTGAYLGDCNYSKGKLKAGGHQSCPGPK